jgi:hypothetical protein
VTKTANKDFFILIVLLEQDVNEEYNTCKEMRRQPHHSLLYEGIRSYLAVITFQLQLLPMSPTPSGGEDIGY